MGQKAFVKKKQIFELTTNPKIAPIPKLVGYST